MYLQKTDCSGRIVTDRQDRWPDQGDIWWYRTKIGEMPLYVSEHLQMKIDIVKISGR